MKRLLILANNPLSDTNSNGRTLKNFFDPSDAASLAQIFISGKDPDFSACARFFRVSDGEVLRAFLKRRSAGRVLTLEDAAPTVGAAPAGKGRRKTPLTLLLRDFLWSRKRWRRAAEAWIDDLAPEAVLLQAGDSPFMYRWALDISKKRGVPLVIYNSEDYYFKDYDFTRSRGLSHLVYPLFRRRLKRAVREAVAHAATSIYISEDLAATYEKEFDAPSEYIYTATALAPATDNTTEGVFSYLGNLGIDRHKSLIKIAEALSHIDPTYKLDVYGKLPDEKVAADLEACPAISYRGLVDYTTVCRVMRESTLLFHAESFEDFYRKDIRHGFSTKIADSLASGSCFVIFAPAELSCTKYLAENGCACVITEESDLEPKLREVIESAALRTSLIERAKQVAEKNHNAEKNRAKMARILNEI